MSQSSVMMAIAVAGFALALVGLGVALLQVSNHPDRVNAAKICFFLAALVLFWGVCYWTVLTGRYLLARLVVDLISLALIIGGLITGLRFANRTSFAELGIPSSAFISEPQPRNKNIVTLAIISLLAATALFNAIREAEAVTNWLWVHVPWLPLSYFTIGCGLTWILFRVWYRYRQGKPAKKSDKADQEVALSDTLRGCQDEWLHEKLRTDKATIWDLVWVASIFYRPEFDKSQPRIEFIFNIFNISLIDIVISMDGGYILFSDDNEQFHFDPKFIARNPARCGSRDTTNFVIRQAVTQDEITKHFKKTDNTRISFGNLHISFRGTEQFPDMTPRPFDVNHYLFTNEHEWQNPNRPKFLSKAIPGEILRIADLNELPPTEMAKRQGVGLSLISARAALGMSVPQLREKIKEVTGADLGESTIRDIEGGKVPNPGYKTLELIALGLGLDPLEVLSLGLDDPPEKEQRSKANIEDKGRVFFEIEIKSRTFNGSSSHAVIYPKRPEMRQRSGFVKVKFRFNNTSAYDNQGKIQLEILRINAEGKEEIAVEIRSVSGQLDKGGLGGGVDFEHIPIKANESTPYIWMFCNFLVESDSNVEGAFVRLRTAAHRQPPEHHDYDVDWIEAISGESGGSDLTPRNSR